jgi:geranylgeranyl pyrophosphate synthase
MKLKRRFVQLLEETGSLKYTREVLKLLIEEINQEIQNHGGNPLMKQEFEEIWRSINKQELE